MGYNIARVNTEEGGRSTPESKKERQDVSLGAMIATKVIHGLEVRYSQEKRGRRFGLDKLAGEMM